MAFFERGLNLAEPTTAKDLMAQRSARKQNFMRNWQDMWGQFGQTVAAKREGAKNRELERERMALERELTTYEAGQQLQRLREEMTHDTSINQSQLDAAMAQLEKELASRENITQQQLDNAWDQAVLSAKTQTGIATMEEEGRQGRFATEQKNLMEQFDRQLSQQFDLAELQRTHEYQMFKEELASKEKLTQMDIDAAMERLTAEQNWKRQHQFPHEITIAEIYARGNAADATAEERRLGNFFQYVMEAANLAGVQDPVTNHVNHPMLQGDRAAAEKFRDGFYQYISTLNPEEAEWMRGTFDRFYGNYWTGAQAGANEGKTGRGTGTFDKYDWSNIEPGAEEELFMDLLFLDNDENVQMRPTERGEVRGAIRRLESGQDLTARQETLMEELLNRFYPDNPNYSAPQRGREEEEPGEYTNRSYTNNIMGY